MTRPRATRRGFLQACAAATLLPGAPLRAWAAPDPSRVALVIGNDAYPGAPLRNAVHDAKAVGSLLADAGFNVDLRTNVDRGGMADAAKTFAAAAANGETRFVFFYYAGHGAQLDWRNYLLPVDAKVNTAADLPAQCLDFAALVREFAKSRGKTFVVVLDACRDNPFGGSFQVPQKGLSQFDAPPGSLLAFSTAPGSVAADGTGQGGLYTQNLVRELGVRSARIEDALKRVRLAVRMASRGAQIPWESTSLESDVYLFPTPAKKLSEKALEEEVLRELAAWNRVKGSQQFEDWIAYLREYPSGKFSEIAQNRLSYFLRVEEDRMALATAPATVAAASASPAVVATAPAAAGPAVVVRAQLEIRPGAPAPVLMRPSENPNSAGTYPLGHRFSVGDEVAYAVTTLGGAARPATLNWRVSRVDEVADRIEINDGLYVLDTMGNLMRWDDRFYDPRFQMEPAELAVGRTWSSRYRLTRGSRVSEGYYDHRVVGRETVTVPAGTFEAFALEAAGFNTTDGSALSLRTWVAPGFNFALKAEHVVRPRSGGAPSGEVREMVSCRQLRWTQA